VHVQGYVHGGRIAPLDPCHHPGSGRLVHYIDHELPGGHAEVFERLRSGERALSAGEIDGGEIDFQIRDRPVGQCLLEEVAMLDLMGRECR